MDKNGSLSHGGNEPLIVKQVLMGHVASSGIVAGESFWLVENVPESYSQSTESQSHSPLANYFLVWWD